MPTQKKFFTETGFCPIANRECSIEIGYMGYPTPAGAMGYAKGVTILCNNSIQCPPEYSKSLGLESPPKCPIYLNAPEHR